MAKKSKYIDKEVQLREFLRNYCRKLLKNEDQRKEAAKALGHEFSYLKAALDQKGKGGLDFWFKLISFCAEVQGDSLDLAIEALFKKERPFQSTDLLSEADLIFKNLSEIPIVNEDIKYRLAVNIRDMLLDLDKDVLKKLKRDGKL